jgi:Ni/Co efflux regulator RcnB
MKRTVFASVALALAGALLSSAAGAQSRHDRDRDRDPDRDRDRDRDHAESSRGFDRFARPTVRLSSYGHGGSGAGRQFVLRTGGRGYVAVIHVAPSGRMEFLYPAHPSSSGRTYGEQRVTLRPRAGFDGRTPSSRSVGYVYAIASREPLDFRRFRSRSGGWRTDLRVGGDRVEALERMTWRLAGRGGDVESTDWLSYRVGGRVGGSSYACRDRDGRWSRGVGLDAGRCSAYLEYEDDGVRHAAPRLQADGGEVLELTAGPGGTLRIEPAEEEEEGEAAEPAPRRRP